MKFIEIYNIFYEALITLYFMRKTGEIFLPHGKMNLLGVLASQSYMISKQRLPITGEDHYLVRGQNALNKIREWATHSEWNFKNKLLLVEAELCNTQKDYDKAASLYEASVKAAKMHKFIHEEAIASECAGIFFSERGLRQKSLSYFKHSSECYKEWGALAVVNRVEDMIQNEFGSDLMMGELDDGLPVCDDFTLEKSTCKKRSSDGEIA